MVGGGRRQESEGGRVKAEVESGRTAKRSLAVPHCGGAGCPCHVGWGALRLREGAGAAKKECSFLTKKATMLLKTKGRENEQSQTKPILEKENRKLEAPDR